jgi:hypothetical protein
MVHGNSPSSPHVAGSQQTSQEGTTHNKVADQDQSAKPVGTAPVPVEGWQPPVFCKSNFRPYTASTRANGGTAKGEKQQKGGSSSATIRKIARRASVELLEVYQQCKSDFRYTRSLNPRRCLTKPSEPVDANGCDNSDSDLIVYVNDVLVSTSTGRKYVVLDKLGQGTFGQARQPTKPYFMHNCLFLYPATAGTCSHTRTHMTYTYPCPQVVKCQAEDNEHYAIKIIRNKPAYTNQALVENLILNMVLCHIVPCLLAL